MNVATASPPASATDTTWPATDTAPLLIYLIKLRNLRHFFDSYPRLMPSPRCEITVVSLRKDGIIRIMKSPFPGMDPYLEARWSDVHNRLCTYISAALQPALPPGLRARAEQDVLLEEPSTGARPSRFEGDIAVIETSPSMVPKFSISGTVATLKPFLLRQIPVLQRSRWVQIIDTTNGNRVITVIEILSPGNKLSGELNKRYRQKLERYSLAGVNIVEIDLLRSGRSRLLIGPRDIPSNLHAAYYTCVNRQVQPDL